MPVKIWILMWLALEFGLLSLWYVIHHDPLTALAFVVGECLCAVMVLLGLTEL